MNFKLFFIVFLILFSCKERFHYLTRIEGKQIPILDTIRLDTNIENFIKPYKEHVNKNLDSVISYALETYTKDDGKLNSTLGNLMADAIFERANPVFFARTGKQIDMVLLNLGGIRAALPKGNITTRSAYNIMPFENSTVVVALKGTQVLKLVNYLKNTKRGHPVSNFKLTLDNNFNVLNVLVNNKPINPEQVYYVATNDYLYNGGDNMVFFKNNESVYTLNYKIRNAFIDYLKQHDTINPKIDDRFTQKNPKE